MGRALSQIYRVISVIIVVVDKAYPYSIENSIE